MSLTPPHKSQQGLPSSSMCIALVSSDRLTQTLAARMIERLAYSAPEVYSHLETMLTSLVQADVILLDAADAVTDWETNIARHCGRAQVIILGELASVSNYPCLSKPLQKEALAASLLDRELKAEITGVDPAAVEELLQLFGAAGLGEMIGALRADLPQQNVRFNHALASGDYAGLKHVAHALHGVALQFGANDFAILCSDIEQHCAEQDGGIFTDSKPHEMMTCYAELISQLTENHYVD